MRTFWIALTGVTVLGLTLVGFIEYGELCDVQAVTMDGAAVPDWQARYHLSGTTPLTRQPAEDLAAELMRRRGVARVEVAYQLPGTIEIRTNDFTAACFAVDRINGTVRALTAEGRIIELPQKSTDWQHPILTGVALGPLYQRCRDLRVLQIIPELENLRGTDSSGYLMLREIDCSDPKLLTASFDDMKARVLVTHAHLAEELRQFRAFYFAVRPDPDSGVIFDARQGKTIIQYLPQIDSLADSSGGAARPYAHAVAAEAATSPDQPDAVLDLEPSAMVLAQQTSDQSAHVGSSVQAPSSIARTDTMLAPLKTAAKVSVHKQSDAHQSRVTGNPRARTNAQLKRRSLRGKRPHQVTKSVTKPVTTIGGAHAE